VNRYIATGPLGAALVPSVRADLGAYGKGTKAPPTIPPNVNNAHPKFRPVLTRLIARVNATLPLKMTQLCRSKEFQCWALFNDGSQIEDPSKGAHVSCLAADFTLDLTPPRHPDLTRATSIWDVGIANWGVPGTVRSVVERPEVLEVWYRFGDLIKNEFPELEWGGNWHGKKGQYPKLGWDPYHVQLKGYTAHVNKDETWKCDPTIGPYQVDPNKDPATAAALRANFLVEEVQDRPFEFAGYGLGTILAGVAVVGGAWWFIKKRRR